VWISQRKAVHPETGAVTKEKLERVLKKAVLMTKRFSRSLRYGRPEDGVADNGFRPKSRNEI